MSIFEGQTDKEEENKTFSVDISHRPKVSLECLL